MQLLIFFTLVAGAFAVLECPENSHYTSCGTACPLTCDNYQNPPKFCVLMCNIGCECDNGYVKAKDGSCILPDDCPAQADEKNCESDADAGLCKGYFPKWYFNRHTGYCRQFIFGGCGGNGNRYASEEECQQHCVAASSKKFPPDVCVMPAVTGVCKGFFEGYSFDVMTGECKKFVYGGCGGNENNFETISECESTCKAQKALERSDCDKAPETGLCNAYFHRYYYDQEAGDCKKFVYGGCGGNKNNFETKEECLNKCGDLSTNVCDEEKVVGPCKAVLLRFYYNKEKGQCKQFIYGGCSGNGNNFVTKEDCEDTCLA